jgi:polysaccharide pyruvyl transferase WcaK-like protein
VRASELDTRTRPASVSPGEHTRRSGILILSGDADGNLGDRAILTATCRALRSLNPSLRITVLSRDPGRAALELGVEVVPVGPRGFASLCRTASKSRVVLVGGGGLFQDDDSRVKMPYWALRCGLARLLCPNVIGHSLGVGPLDSTIGRLCARAAFATMRKVTVRDPLAHRTARPLTSRSVFVVPDPAFLITPGPRDRGAAALAEAGVPLTDGPLIGAAIRRWFPPRSRWIPNRVTARFGVSGER